MKFYNRTNEIERLRLALGHSSPQFLVIYGRRRCGKSTLLRHIMAADDVYYMATQSDASVQRSLIARQISEQFPGFNRSVYPDWLQLFEALRERADRRFTLIIDEFPYLAKSDSSLPSTLQLLLEDRDKLGFDLIICSSSQQMMQHYAIKASSPLYGRADEIIKVSPLQAGWLSEHLSDHSDEEIIKEYATWGGVPRYWELRARYSNYIEAVQKLIMDPIGILHEEPNRLLLDDIRDPGFSISLLASIAQGANKLSEIGGRLNRPATDLNRPLNRLIGLGYLKRDRPFGAKAKDKKRNLYKVSDPFMRFYFRYIFPAASDFELNIYDNTIRKIETSIDQFISEEWENLSRLAVAKSSWGSNEYLPPKRWWGKGTDGKMMEIDMLSESRDGKSLLIGECKWSDITNTSHLLSTLEDKARNLPMYKDQKLEYVLAGKSYIGNIDCKWIGISEVLNYVR